MGSKLTPCLRSVAALTVTLLLTFGDFCSAESFNRTIVILNSHGGVSSVTNITVGLTDVPTTAATTTDRRGVERKLPQLQVPTCGSPSIPTNMDSVAQFKEWPWHVAIVEAKEDLYICGGSLISETKILTGAHCLMPYSGVPGKTSPKPRLKIRAGEWDVSTNSEPLPHIEVLVHKMTLHPQFDNRTLENDIAVIHLARPILPGFRNNISPVCLPSGTSNENNTRSRMSSLKRCVVTGWGRKTETSGYSVVLKEIIVPLWESDRCERQLRKHFGPAFLLPPSALCAGAEENDACDGDGGGPLVCFHDGKWVQEGIVSYGVGCGRGDSPGIYTRVSSYLPFLENELL